MKNRGVAAFGSIAGCVILTWPATALTQTAPPQNQDDEVVVTGSRLTRSIDEATAPVVVIDRAAIEHSASGSIGRILQKLPQQNGFASNTGDGFGDGSSRIDLRGLGDQRTLVLLNGRRFVYGGLGADTSVDIDMIPLSMIERVEVSASGASTVYGSDAVAGVVNIITRRDFDGLNVGARYGLSEHSDGSVRMADATYGMHSDRFNLIAGLEYFDESRVRMGSRAYSSHVESLTSLDGPAVNTGSFITPHGLYDLSAGNDLGLPADYPIYTRVTDATGYGAADFRPFVGPSDLFNYAPYNDLQTPSDRRAAWVLGRLHLSENTEAFAELLAFRRHSEQDKTPGAYSSFNIGAAQVDPLTGAQIVPANNYYNPFGADIYGLFRMVVEGGPRTNRQTVETNRVLAGLRGSLGTWHWEASATWARSETDEFQGAQILRGEVRRATGPSGLDAQGRIVCGVPDPNTGVVASANIIAGCVPLNVFGPIGSITQDQLAYVERDLHNTGFNQHWLADLSITGNFGHLPGGEIRWAVGGQYRRESAALNVDPQYGEGVTGTLVYTVPDGAHFDAREAFIEMNAPLIRDAPAARAVDLVLGARHSSFNAFGSSDALQGGLHWNVVRGLTLRGGYSEVFRAPATVELFASQIEEQRAGIADPCSDPTPQQRINCVANGVPGGSYEADPTEGTRVLSGANPGLDAEGGYTWNAGVLLTPGPFRASIDFWHVKLNDSIEAPGAQAILDNCADSGTRESCALISRQPDGSLNLVDARLLNLASQSVSGIDVGLGVGVDTRAGRFDAQLTATFLRKYRVREFTGGGTTSFLGIYDFSSFASWRRRSAFTTVDWQRGPWQVSYANRYIGSYTECGDKNFAFFKYLSDDDCRKVKPRVYHDVWASRQFRKSVRLTAAVQNLLDTDPPRVNLSDTANTDASLYPTLGRSWMLGASLDLR